MVQKTLKQRGRPRNFDEIEALEGAMRVFWAKGYDGATIDDLVAEMGIGRPSLYATFGDKESLFARCLDQYSARSIKKLVPIVQDSVGVREAVRGYMSEAVLNATAEDGPKGCLMACVAPAVADPKILSYIASAITGATNLIAARLQKGIDDGELPPEFPIERRAKQIINASMAFTIRARVGAPREELLGDVEVATDLFLNQSV